ncbi:TetR/AcrR family transcriptional regulator [Massilia antarctica]|uniref:TetR/AcrR family transcriptional regulator n=1 Tax=Massilia antarctica TaxID=2765360 RepID=UPI0006BB560D|nr:TetR/AcrR family transcriptional regulator [Massilia sp. H27-R4]MCY0915133.1 TetR/AcrR family transcriptional regulator [Massilia sp. H27-R4]CUI07113.1 Transcriptional regulator, TetR family [Janthinobacterium sp. CG23_2]CUU30899.1 Transcriptional regulator, TetR family [Janthinobacterium sp. CG23_2]
MEKRFATLSASAERVVDAAQRLIQQYGYNGFSYDDIAREIDIKKPSIHHHFRTKADLVHTIVQRYGDRFATLLRAIDETCEDAPARLARYGELFAATYQQDRRLCVCGILGAEAAAMSPEVALEVRAFFQLNLDWLAKTILDGERAGLLRVRGGAEAQAYGLLSALEGAMMVGRGCGSDHSPALAGTTYVSNMLV